MPVTGHVLSVFIVPLSLEHALRQSAAMNTESVLQLNRIGQWGGGVPSLAAGRAASGAAGRLFLLFMMPSPSVCYVGLASMNKSVFFRLLLNLLSSTEEFYRHQ
jgi:hypothetical protein